MVFIRLRSVLMPFRRRRIGRERMRPPRLAEAPDQRRVRRFEKDQRRIQPLHAAQLPVGLRKLGQKVLLPNVDDDGDAGNAFAAHELGAAWGSACVGMLSTQK